MNQIIQEFKNMCTIIHQNIVKVFEIHIMTIKKKVLTFMEYVNGWELFILIVQRGKYGGNRIFLRNRGDGKTYICSNT